MVREDAWYHFNFLKFTEVWFVTQDVVYPGECSVYTWEGVFFCIWMEILKISMRSILSNVLFKTLCDPIDGSPPGSPVLGILQAGTLEWVAISFSIAWKWKVKVKSLSRIWLVVTAWTAAYQAHPSMGFSRQEYWSGVPLPSPSVYARYYPK